MTRGDVYELRLRPRGGHEQSGRRLGVVVQSDDFAALSTVLIAPTSMHALAALFRPEIEVAGVGTRVLVEQTTAIDATRLGKLVGHLTPEETWGLDDALKVVLDL